MYPDHPIERLRACPPFLVHALARKRNKRMPLSEIVQRSGLSERTYLRTARKDTWDGVKFSVMTKFFRGCGVDPFKMRSHYRFLREHNFTFPYLTKKQKAIMDEICSAKIS